MESSEGTDVGGVETGSGRGTRPMEGTSVASNLFTCSRSESGIAAGSNGADGSGCQTLGGGGRGGGGGGGGRGSWLWVLMRVWL